MIPSIDKYDMVVIAYWLTMLVIATFILVYVTVYCTGENPGSFLRAAMTTLLVGGVVFFTYDLSGYIFAIMMQDPTTGVHLPPGYSYWDWLKEPLALKWQVLGFVPLIRYLPILFALIIGSIVQVFLWKVPFQLGLLIFIAQIVLNLMAMMALSFLFGVGIRLYEQNAAQHAEHRPAERPAAHREGEPENLHHVRNRVERLPAEHGNVWRRVHASWDSFNGSLKPMYNFLQPVTDQLPLPAQDFLNSGGWLLAVPGVAGLVWCLRRSHRRHQHHGHHHTKRPHAAERQRIRLDLIGDGLTGLGAKQVTVNGVPGRLRLVVMSPAGAGTNPVMPAVHSQLLDSIVLGLAAVSDIDFPKVECWNDPRARSSFRGAILDAVQFPEPDGTPSRWQLLIGDVDSTQLGLAIVTKQPNDKRVIEVAPAQWSQIVGLRNVPKDDQGW